MTPVKGKRTPQKKEPATAKKSKLMGFFKREKKSSVADHSPLLPTHSNTFPAKQRHSSLLDEISVGEELYPLDLATGPITRDTEEHDVVGDLDSSRQMYDRRRNKRPSVSSYSSIQSSMPEDLEVVKNWAKLSAGSVQEDTTGSRQSLGTVKTVLLYKPPKTQPKPLGFTLHGGSGSHFGEVGVHIKTIATGSLAAADERLMEGDEVLEVNSHLVDGMTHKKVAHLIKVCMNMSSYISMYARSVYVRSVYVRSVYVRSVYVRSVCVRSVCVRSVCVRSVCVRSVCV